MLLSDRIKFIESVFGRGRLAHNGKNIDVRCPICAPTDPTKKKLAILVEDDRMHCWVCGFRARSLAPLISRFGTREQMAEYRDRYVPSTVRDKRLFCDDVAEQKKLELPRGFRMLVNASFSDPDVNAARQYLMNRGLSNRDLWYFKLGISDDSRWRRRIIVPSFDASGSLNYFVGRAIDARRRPKYDNPHLDRLPIIFNELNVDWTQRLVICEGTFDMFKCGDNVVPLLGSDLNEESALFSAILMNNTPVAVALDGDMWETKTIKVAKKLVQYNIDVTLVDTRSFGDPGSATVEQVRSALAAATSFEWVSSFRTKLNRASRVSL